ncbi:MAG: OB-fold nucleic acid binding domain-containing protein [DPANN group archaeon]|nr:OB-fold nucleic acid binding domain-containing protein [DPANN group archaeon]
MGKDIILVIALCWSLIGLTLLLSIGLVYTPPTINISDATNKIDENVIVIGSVVKSSYQDSVNFITIRDVTGKIQIVFFDEPNFKVSKGDIIQVEGEIQEYERKTEIIAKEIRCIDCG